MDKRHWKDCSLSLTHGNIIQRTIFTKKDSDGSEPEEAVLRYIDHYARGWLETGVSSTPHTSEAFQEVFFVAGGSGKLVADGQERPFQEGDGMLIPPGVEHIFVNDGDAPLEFLMISESIPEGTVPQNETPLIRNYRESNLLVSHWSYLVHPIFGQQDGLVQMRDVLVVLIDPLLSGDGHGHGPDMDEVWTVWKGEAVHMVGKEACVQTPGTAVSVCPSHPGHTLINHTEEPVYLFYFCSQDYNG